MQQLSPKQLHERLQQTDKPLLLDVREPWEFEICHIADSLLIPMGQIPTSFEKLEPERETVLICHHGVRSMQVAIFLQSRGFKHLWNLQGGIDAWAHDIDPDMASY